MVGESEIRDDFVVHAFLGELLADFKVELLFSSQIYLAIRTVLSFAVPFPAS